MASQHRGIAPQCILIGKQLYNSPEVMLYGAAEDVEGNLGYAEGVEPSVWNVYVKWTDARGSHWPFEITSDNYYGNIESAREMALYLAACHETTVEEY